jgi:2-pyrone-4,6-dicarboxylate lactonase
MDGVNAQGLCLAPGEPTSASFLLPAGACDCHAHVLGPFDRYPLAAVRPYDPPEAALNALRSMMERTGLQRIVIAHVSAHGMDLSVTLDAIEALGENARGTAMLLPSASDERLQELDRRGIRGVRLSKSYGGDTPLDEDNVRNWAARVGPLGWHLAVWPSSLDELRMLARVAGALPAPVVLDHLASHAWFSEGRAGAEGLAILQDMLTTGRVWLKLSGMYRSGAGAFPWTPLIEPMARIAASRTDRMLWASDWPYVGLYDKQTLPRSGDLLDWLRVIGLDQAARDEVLVRNPEQLYGFDPVHRQQ